MFVDAHVTILCESIRKGCEFRALFFDGVTEQFYGGSGSTALEAVAWCFDEYVRRGVLRGEMMPARNASARPGDELAEVRPRRERRITPAPIGEDGPAASAGLTGSDSTGCFEQQVPTRPAPLLHGQPSRRTKAPRKRASGGR